MSVPYGGGARALKMVLSGDDFDLPMADPLKMRRIQRTFDGPFMILPSEMGWGSDPLVLTPGRNYSASDYMELFQRARAQCAGN